MIFQGATVLLALVQTCLATSVPVEGASHYVFASDLPAGGNRTYSFAQPMLLYVSRHESNQKYDTNIRFIDDKSGVRVNAWAAAQSLGAGGTKKPVFLEGRTSITVLNFNENVFDDTLLPAVFYFVDASLGCAVYEATEAVERRKQVGGDNATLTVMSASMSITLFDFKFPSESSLRLTAGGAAEVENESNEIITFDDPIFDASSWANLPLPIVTVTSSEMVDFQLSVSTKQAERSMAPVGVRTVVMSPGYSFANIPSKDRKYSFKLKEMGTVRVEYVGSMRLGSSALEVVGSDASGRQTYDQKFDSKSWANRTTNATFSAETLSVAITHSLGSPAGILVRIYTSGSSFLSLVPLLFVCLARLL